MPSELISGNLISKTDSGINLCDFDSDITNIYQEDAAGNSIINGYYWAYKFSGYLAIDPKSV